MNIISYRYFIAIAILAFVCGYAAIVSAQAGLTGVPGGSTVCYPDGCAVLNFQTTKAEWDTLAGNKATLAETFETIIQRAISIGDVINELTRDAAGRIVWVACGNSHTHAMYFDPTCTISAHPTMVPRGNSKVALTWNSTNGTSASIDNGVGAVDLNGSVEVYPTVSATYTLTVAGAIRPGSCNTGIVTVIPPPSCRVTLEKNQIDAGESTVVHWESTNAAVFYLNSIGYVGQSGSATVSPSHTTDFSGYVSNWASPGGDASYCPATLRVNQADTECPPGTRLVKGVCVVDDDDGNPDDTATDEPGSCAIGYEYMNGACVFVSCPVGYVKQANACVFQGCPVGYTLQNGACIWTGCPEGFLQQGSQCVLENQCVSLPYCSGKDLRNGCTHELIQVCQYGCANGACKGVPAPTAALSASPAVVKKGQSTKLTWNSKNTASCTLTGGNGDSFSALTATNQVSGPINSTTIFTLHCDGYDGSSPASVEKSVTVSVRADYEEK